MVSGANPAETNSGGLEQAQPTLHQNEEELRRIVDLIPQQIVVLDASGRATARALASQEEQKLVWATHFAPAADIFTRKVDGTAWKSKPSWCIVAKNDRTVHSDLERFVAKRMGAVTYEADTSYVPMLSNPSLMLDVIRTAANAIQVRSTAA